MSRLAILLKRFGCGLLEFVFPWGARRFCDVDQPFEIEDYPNKVPKQGFPLQSSTRLILALGPVVLGAWVSMHGRELLEATERFLWGPRWEVYWPAVLFWITAAAWTRALYMRLNREDRFESTYRVTLVRTLYHLPNLNVLWDYHDHHKAVVRALEPDFFGSASHSSSVVQKATTAGKGRRKSPSCSGFHRRNGPCFCEE